MDQLELDEGGDAEESLSVAAEETNSNNRQSVSDASSLVKNSVEVHDTLVDTQATPSYAEEEDGAEEARCSRQYPYYSLVIEKPGPMLIKLLFHSSKRFAITNGFEKTADGKCGEAELKNMIEWGDALLAINGQSLINKPFESILTIIRNETKKGCPRKLSFWSKNHLIELLENSPKVSLCLQMIKNENQSQSQNGEGRKENPSAGPSTSQQVVSTAPNSAYLALLFEVSENINNPAIPTIDLPKLRKLATLGIPDTSQTIRSIAWKILLKYLPVEKSLWNDHLSKQRQLYKDLLAEVTIQPMHYDTLPPTSSSHAQSPDQEQEQKMISRLKIRKMNRKSIDDDPLSMHEGSRWSTYWRDQSILDSIQVDVIRTYPELKFFLEGEGKCQQIMQNVLFLYAKLNPGVRYVQGMNELVGTLYYVFANENVEQSWRDFAEADTFFCFSSIMADFRDLYISKMDNTQTGINGHIKLIWDILNEFDSQVISVLKNQGVDPSFYSLRWITTLLSREFDLLDVIQIWDRLFSAEDKHEFLNYFCCGMVLHQRDKILNGDFSSNLSLLQSYPPTNVNILIDLGNQLRLSKHRRRKNSGQTGNEKQTLDVWMSASLSKVVHSVSQGMKNIFSSSKVRSFDVNSEPPESRYYSSVTQTYQVPGGNNHHSSTASDQLLSAANYLNSTALAQSFNLMNSTFSKPGALSRGSSGGERGQSPFVTVPLKELVSTQGNKTLDDSSDHGGSDGDD